MRLPAEASGRAPNAALADADLQVALARRLNVLLTGNDADIEMLLHALGGHVPHPIARWQPTARLTLSSARAGTLLLRDVGMLTPDDQLRLDGWLDGQSGVQVVSTTRRSLLARVERGAFLDRLYYRLNTVCIVFPEPPAPATPRRV